MAILNRSFLFAMGGFVAGAATLSAGFVIASPVGSVTEPSDQTYLVSIDEIRSNFVEGQVLSHEFTRKITLSDGASHQITLRPVRRNGEELVELIDTTERGSSHSFMGPNGTTTNGPLMINVKDIAELKAMMKKHPSAKK